MFTDSNLQTGRRRLGSLKLKNLIIPWLFVLPGVVFTFIFRYYTMFDSFWISLHRYDITKQPGEFIGFENYTTMLQNPDFWRAWKNTLVFAILALLLTFWVPIVQAIFLSELVKGRGIFSSLYLIPAVIPLSVTVIIWKWIFHPNYGVANYIMGILGIPAQTWFSDPKWTTLCITIPGMIGGGFSVLLYLSAIMGIPNDIREAAQIDGCSGFKKLFYITLPNISFLIMIQLILTVISVMQTLDAPLQFTSGGPGGASTSVSFFIYQKFNKEFVYGQSTAVAFMLLIVIAVVTSIQMRLDKSEKE